MRLNGKRIIVRDLELTDVDDYFLYCGSDLVGPSAGWKPIKDYETAKRVIAGQVLQKDVYAIVLKAEEKMIGTISIYNYGIRKYKYVKQLGFSMNSDYWNCGYMTEAVKMVIDYVFTKTDCEVLEVGHHSDNFKSKRVIEKCGFIYDGRFCKYKKLYDGRIVDADFYSLTRDDFERMKKYE
jgi:RimJ/RimL family protein N-acetyltransferase